MDVVLTGEVEPDAARLVVSQEQFYQFLSGDIGRAARRVVIYSPFLTQNRLAWLHPHLQAAVDRGVFVCVVTRPLVDRGKRELTGYRMLERALHDWGIIVLHKRRMHEKLVFVDDDVLWSGSLNPLSFSDTQEIMERRASERVSSDYARKLRLDELLEVCAGGNPQCDVCGAEMVLGEGRQTLYWLCTNSDCGYSRDFDAPAAENGLVSCGRCGGSVEFGDWGGNPSWRCLANPRHHQKVARAHLLLPKMRAIIPSPELGVLDERFGIERGRPRVLDQPGLFGGDSVVRSASPREQRERADGASMRKKGTTRPGYVTLRGQEVIRRTSLPGTDHYQWVYELRCQHCDTHYGANGSDIHLRKCPSCQGGAPGLPFRD